MKSDNGSFVDPSSLSLPSPSSTVLDSPRPDNVELAAGPSRKRSRTDMTTEERKEARAHRNRIAAQNSRDKRKAQFVALERRVAELEEENRQLRAGMSLTDLQRSESHQRREDFDRDRTRDRENAELKERIKSLEKGWETVMKVLAAQGIPTNSVVPPSPPQSNNSTTTFPVLVPSAPVFPITPSPTLSSTSILLESSDESESTRHLARVATTAAIPPAVSLQRSALQSPIALAPQAAVSTYNTSIPGASSSADEAAVDAWIREILTGSPVMSPQALPSPVGTDATASPTTSAPLTESVAAMDMVQTWENEAEIQRLLDMVPIIQSDGGMNVDSRGLDIPATLGLELCGDWNFGRERPSASGVGVF